MSPFPVFLARLTSTGTVSSSSEAVYTTTLQGGSISVVTASDGGGATNSETETITRAETGTATTSLSLGKEMKLSTSGIGSLSTGTGSVTGGFGAIQSGLQKAGGGPTTGIGSVSSSVTSLASSSLPCTPWVNSTGQHTCPISNIAPLSTTAGRTVSAISGSATASASSLGVFSSPWLLVGGGALLLLCLLGGVCLCIYKGKKHGPAHEEDSDGGVVSGDMKAMAASQSLGKEYGWEKRRRGRSRKDASATQASTRYKALDSDDTTSEDR